MDIVVSPVIFLVAEMVIPEDAGLGVRVKENEP
jgi:hypothetical protein